MLLDDQIPNLPKIDDDELVLDHMDNETLKRLNVYRGQPNEPKLKRKFAAIANSYYQAPADDKWRHDNSDSGSETEKMRLYKPKKTMWWVKHDEKKKKKTPTPRTPKATTRKATPKRASKKKSPPHLIDEPDEVPPEKVNVTSDEVETTAGGEKSGKNIEVVKETFVEGEVHTDSSETESDIDLTQIATTTAVSGKIRMKGPSRRKKDSDEEDATYVPSEVEKITKGREKMKRKAQPTGEVPRRQKIWKTTTKVMKDTSGIPEQLPIERVENVEKVAEFEKAIAESEEKLKKVEIENVVLNNEIPAMNEKLLDVEVGNNVLNDMIDELLSTNVDLNDSHATMSTTNQIMQKEIVYLRAYKENKSKQIEMLYVVIEDRLGINVHAAYDDIEIRRAEGQRMEKQQRDVADAAKDKGKGIAVEEVVTEEVLESSSQQEQQSSNIEVNTETTIVLAQWFVLVGEAVDVPYSRDERRRRDELKRRKEKKDDKEDGVEEEEDEEQNTDELFKDIEDYRESNDNDDDDDDDDDQGGNSGAMVVSHTSDHQELDFIDDTQNEEREEDRPQGSRQVLNMSIYYRLLLR
ncbi:hypothetical protein Hdeb2414_s0123g00804061 [Helianthus debilis subsp. tardiflorus]